MARIPGSEGLGQAIARPLRLNETQTPREAFGGGLFDAVARAGAGMIAEDARAAAEKRAADEAEVRQAWAERKAADRAQALGAMQSAADELTLAADELSEGVRAGQRDKTKAEEEWGTLSRERIGQVLEQVPQEHRPAVQRDLEHRAFSLGRATVRKAVRERDRADTRAGIDQTLESAMRLYARDPARAEELMAGALDSLGPAAGYDQAEIGRRKQAWRETTQFTAGYEAVSAGRQDPKALDRAEELIRSLPDLDPQKRATLLDRSSAYRMAIEQRAELARQRAQREEERRLSRAKAEFDVFQAMADKGTVLDQGYIDRAVAATAGTPYAQGIAALARQARETGGFAAQPIAVQQAALDAITAEIAQRGRTPELDKRRDQIEKVLRGSREDLERDPLRAGMERGVIEALPPINLARGVQGLVPQLAARVDAAQRVQRWAGRPVSPLTADEAATVKGMLDVLPVKERSVLVAGLAGALGPQAAAGLAAQMDKKDKALALAFATAGAQTTENRLVSELILRGQQAKADGTSTKGDKEPDKKAGAWRAHAAAELDGVFGNAAFTAQVRDAAEFVMHGIAAEQGGRLSKDDMDRAVRLALGGSIVEHNGRKIPLPAGLDEDALGKRLRAVTADEIKAQAPGGVLRAAGAPLPVDEFVKALPGQQLMPVRPGEFAVLVGGRPVTNAEGVPVIVRVR